MIMDAFRLFLIICLFSTFVSIDSSVTDIYIVSSIADIASNDDPGACSPSSPSDSSLCNLRSAFGYCVQNVFTSPPATCAIHIYAGLSLPFNTTLGPLNYTCDSVNCMNHLYIHANNSKITSSGQSGSTVGLIHLINTIITVNNLIAEGFNTREAGNGSVLSLDHCTLNLYNSVLKNNAAENGGAIYVAANSTVSIVNSKFISNFASGFGGAVAIDNNNTVSVTNCSFDGNQATVGGGAVSIYEGNRNAIIENSIFTSNMAITSFANKYVYDTYGGGAVFFYQYNDYLILRNNSFQENRADYNNLTYVSYTVGLGGAVTIVYYNDHVLIEGCNFFDNFGLFGGGLLVKDFNHYVDIVNTTFSFNQAHENMTNLIGGDGGAIDIHLLNYYVTIDGCKFESNIAKGAAGAVKLGIINYYSNIINSNFTNNTLEVGSKVGGGAIHMNYGNVDVNVENCSFISNVANTAAGVYVSRVNNNVKIRKCLFEDNVARSYHAGGMCIRFTNKNVDVNECQFNRNKAFGGKGGGAILIENYNQNITVRNSLFNENEFNWYAYGGGAISLWETNTDVTLLNLTIENSISKAEGGGVYVFSNNSYVTLAGCQIKRNYAESGGGYSLNQDNDNFVVVSSEVYKNTQVLQTEHPYTPLAPVNNVPQIIFNQTVTIADANELILVFDSQSELSGNEPFYIYTNSSQKELLYTNLGFDPWPGVARPPLRFQLNSIFVLLTGPTENFKTPNDFYGFKMTVYPSGSKYMSASDSSLSENNADGAGGGGKVYFLNDNCILIASEFHGNTAHDGGAFYIQSVNGGPTISHCSFVSNRAYSGGGLLLSSSNYGAGLFDCVFSNNVADQVGGGVYMVSSNGEGLYILENYVNVSGVTFINNSAYEGGSIYLGSYNIIKISNTVFIDSSALENGGAVHADAENDISITNTTFQGNNAAVAGGGVMLLQSNMLSIADGIFKSNVAFLGAGLALLNDSGVIFAGNTTFEENDGHLGGGIALRAAPLWSLASGAHVILNSNVAYKGSAIAFANIKTSTESLRNLHITNNFAKQGGTVYWLFGSNNVSDEPQGLHSSDISWGHNTALYGEKWTTQAVTFSSTDYFVTQYNEVLSPSYSVQMLDYYGEKILNENSTSAAIDACLDCLHECNDIFFSVTGQLETKSVGSILEWIDIRASCYPQGFFTISIDGISIDPQYFGLNVIEQYKSSGQGVMSFRDCYDGEYLETTGSCIPCAYGFYSYKFDATQLCTVCPPEASQCQKNLTDLKSSYWRESTYATTILACPYDTCIGGTGVSDALCREGSTGPLCATCMIGYYYSSEKLQCVKCVATSYLSETLLVLIVLFFIVLVIVAYVAYLKCFSPEALQDLVDEKGKDGEASDFVDEESNKSNEDDDVKSTTSRVKKKPSAWQSILGAYLSIRCRDLDANFKIIVSTLQILVQVPKNFLIKFPGSYMRFLEVFQVMNVDVNGVTNWKCSNHSYDYIDKLIIVTVVPIALLVVLLVVFVLQGICIRNKMLQRGGDDRESELLIKVAKLRRRLVSITLVITFLVLPSVSTVIFGTYSCADVDPGGQSSGSYGRYYLREDYSIECSGRRYYFGVIWASVMVMVYPLGVPLLNFWLLYKRRHEIKHRLDPLEDAAGGDDEYVQSMSTVRTISDDTRMIEFLYRSYMPNYWYFEIVETFRRLFFTAFISVMSPGSSAQLLVAIVMSFFFLRVYNKARPFLEYGTATLSQYAMDLVFFTYVGATFVGKDLLSENSTDVVTGLLLFGAVFLVFLAIMYELNNYRGYLAYRRMLDSEEGSHTGADTDGEDNSTAKGFYKRQYEAFVANNMHRPSSRRVNEKDKRVTSESQHFDPSIDNREVKRTDLGKIRGVNLDDVKKFVGVSFRSFLLPVFKQEGRQKETAPAIDQNSTQNPLTDASRSIESNQEL